MGDILAGFGAPAHLAAAIAIKSRRAAVVI
jgi:hypothetical protein